MRWSKTMGDASERAVAEVVLAAFAEVTAAYALAAMTEGQLAALAK